MYNDKLSLIEIFLEDYFAFYIMTKDYRQLIDLVKIGYLIQNKLRNDDLK